MSTIKINYDVFKKIGIASSVVLFTSKNDKVKRACEVNSGVIYEFVGDVSVQMFMSEISNGVEVEGIE